MDYNAIGDKLNPALTGNRAFFFPVYKKEGQFGDLYITYTVKIPTHLTEKQKKLFAELSKS